MSEAKSNIKKDKKKSQADAKDAKQEFRTTIKFQNTITFYILAGITVLVCFVQGFWYTYIQDGLKDIQNDISSDIISSLKVFNKDMEPVNPEDIKNNLNSVLQGDNEIKDVIVISSDKTKIYSSIKNGKFDFANKKNPASLRVVSADGYNAGDYRLIYIPLRDYYVYLSVLKNSDSDFKQFKNFSLLFFIFILMLGICFSMFLARSISKPLSKMENTISKIGDGDLSERLDYTRYYEINKLIQSYNLMADTLQRLYSALEAQVADRTKELRNAYAELKDTQAMMMHSEKMKSLGELVAGIMHEINNPINFIYGNMVHLNNYSQDLINVIDKYTKYDTSLKTEEKADIDNLKQEIDYEFLKSDLPDLIRSCKEGADRAKNIIQDLKSFSRMEDAAISKVDLNHEIDMTLNILHNKLKNKAAIHKEFMEDMPLIEAYGGQLNQVFMNILDNAAGALKDKGDIWIRINEDASKKHLNIEIEDNGSGMDEETARKIFDPFFTTKPVGKGTGLGLSITYKIIKNHQGDIRVESQPNMGSKFIITLPIEQDREITANAAGKTGEKDGQV